MKNQTKTNKKTRRTSILFYILLTVYCFLSLNVSAQGGTTGPLTWNIDNGILTISGEGDMPDYSSPNYAPWFEYGGQINKCVIEIGVRSIGNWAFNYSNMTSITIPNSVIRIRGAAFWNCTSLKSITIPNSVTSIGKYAFENCYNLISIKIPNSVTSIEDDAFYLCTKLASITLPDNLEKISNGILGRCERLTSIIIPSNVTSIGNDAFFWCFGLTSITIPSCVTSIGDKAFYDCNKLISITNLNPNPVSIAINPSAFWSVNTSKCNLRVPTSALSAYQSAAVWTEFHIVGSGILVRPISNNTENGYTTGNALYQINETATVTAVPVNGYRFVNWTMDGLALSTDNPYSFTVMEDIELVANFKENTGVSNSELIIFEIYPNPTTSELRIENGELKIINVEIFDVYGRNIEISTQVRLENSGSENVINISHLQEGIYFIKIYTEAGAIVKKFVKN
jgi:hypothetical protein